MSEIVAKEFRFGMHVPAKNYGEDDWHIIKEVIHKKDGTCERRLRALKNYERPVWFTKHKFRNHKEKKESEHIDKLDVRKVTQSQLRNEIAKALDKAWSRDSIRDLCESPFVYGSDVSATTIINQTLYRKLYPNTVTPYSVCFFDTETSMFDEHGTIIIASIAFEGKVVLIVRKDIIGKYNNPEFRFNECVEKYLKPRYGTGPTKDILPFEIEFLIADSEIDIIKKSFDRIHAWKPDFLAIWNMDYDITKILEACKREKVDPADILCDPALPANMRRCYYKRGKTRKVTAAGKSQPLSPSAQWHTFFLTASFYCIDPMSTYRLLRLQKQELENYKLNTVLEANGLGGKFKFSQADGYVEDAWHKIMQSTYLFEYMIYAIGDSYEMKLLDDKTRDLSSTLPGYAATTDFWDFNSQPKRLRDAIFWDWLYKHGHIVATVGPSKQVEPQVTGPQNYGEDGEDDDGFEEEVGFEDSYEMKVLNRKGWVLTLPAHMNVLGLPLLKGEPLLRTLIRAFTYDSDAVSAYPRCVITTNYSKATTRKELTRVRNRPEEIFRLQNLNMIMGDVNAQDYSRTMFKMPRSRRLLEDFKRELETV